jgi:ABC-type antimicrobial peptide transport system permease subunit
MANQRFTLILFTTFAVVALLLAALGIYGVMSFAVAQRAHEIALRMALGSTRDRVAVLVIRDGVLLAVIELGLGLIGAYFVGRALLSMRFGVQPLDSTAFISVAALLLSRRYLGLFPARPASRLRRTDASAPHGITNLLSPTRSIGSWGSLFTADSSSPTAGAQNAILSSGSVG